MRTLALINLLLDSLEENGDLEVYFGEENLERDGGVFTYAWKTQHVAATSQVVTAAKYSNQARDSDIVLRHQEAVDHLTREYAVEPYDVLWIRIG